MTGLRSLARRLLPLKGLAALLALAAGAAAAQESVSGAAEVIDADILRIGQQRVILWGIDAPERRQDCYQEGRRWGCHDAARRTLQLLAGRGEITCVLVGEPDPFNRRHGVCEAGGEDINGAMVRRGMALAFLEQTADYEPQQLEAIAEGVGLWQAGVEFEEPWIFRRVHTPGGYR
jgi:endonuclease YncB( thermonuclease family)